MESVTRESPVTVLPGIGKVRASCYEKLGIRTLGDLLSHYPRAYENRGDLRLLTDARTDGKSAVLLTVATEPKSTRLRSHKSFLKFRAYDDSASCEIVYFNQDYLKSAFPLGSVFRFYGKVERKGKNYSMSSPTAEAWAPGCRLPALYAVYPLTEGLSQKQIAKDVDSALKLLSLSIEEPLPDNIRERRSLCLLSFAEQQIHCPESAETLAIARRRLVYQEFFDFSLGMAILRQRAKTHGAPVCRDGDISALTACLPYRLTNAQLRVIDEIRRDMATDVPMNRIIVGDVGCGKTVCAAAAIVIAVRNGRQAALMAPTEILARQHAQDLSALFSGMGITSALLTGSTPTAEKKRIRTALSETDPAKRLDVVIGTHALLSEGVEFAVPGLVVTDEQHRFGARQRAVLLGKNRNAHLLVMSATPIPRSLALILYGDLSLSRIDEMPPGRQRVDTFVVNETYRTRLNGFIRQQTDAGGQVYVVCPAIEEQQTAPDELELTDVLTPEENRKEKPPLKSAVAYADTLAQEFPDLQVAFLHGKLKSTEKDSIMQAFVNRETQILVSTTVIEVGVNVPNACLMIVENAERFGLSQLHQLRGRVGRGQRKSYCVLVTGGTDDPGEHATTRLQTMHTTYDGYQIAEQDLLQRGPGDFLASSDHSTVRQSGTLSFRLGNAASDVTVMTEATEDARALLSSDPALHSFPALQSRLSALSATPELVN